MIVLQEIEDFKFYFLYISLYCRISSLTHRFYFVMRNQCEWWFCHEIAKGGDCKDSRFVDWLISWTNHMLGFECKGSLGV